MTRTVLLVEDSEPDVRLIRRVLARSAVPPDVVVAGDGQEALALLRDPDAQPPGVILLDLNMPRMDGFATLAALKADARLRRIPVIVLTSTHDPASIDRAYDLQASAFVTKPTALDGYRALLDAFDAFWLREASLPRPGIAP